ncbi:hypothetical protein [Pedobacter sp. SYSU D00535]|uniref:hypothetical protein n=1 Tax=Pedobacter sp. SYSU D00535 TaxID=2810308 RepID=UPI001A96A743|nr:hypothetical protein [Pedobacter sp. SYSU D00535]
MRQVKTKAILRDREVEVTIQKMRTKKGDDSQYFYLHSMGDMIAVISYNKDCTFKVIDGHYTLKELKKLCQHISKFETEDADRKE